MAEGKPFLGTGSLYLDFVVHYGPPSYIGEDGEKNRLGAAGYISGAVAGDVGLSNKIIGRSALVPGF